jgi:hypothetical protein
MEIDAKQIFEVSGYEIFFEGDCQQSLVNIAEQLGEGATFDFDNYSIIGTFERTLPVPAEELINVLRLIREQVIPLADDEKCRFVGSELSIVSRD